MEAARTISEGQWDLICAIEEFWHRKRFFPSADQIREIAPRLTGDLIRESLDDAEFVARLERRGIDIHAQFQTNKSQVRPNATRLTDKQLAVAMCLLNVADSRSISSKLKSLGVPEATYNGWLKSHVFNQFMQDQMENLFGSALPLVHKALIDKAVTGDFKSIKLIYEMTGRWRGVESQNTDNFKVLVFGLIEILQKHIDDPVKLQVIAEEMKSLSPNSFGDSSNGGYTEIRSLPSGGVEPV